VARRLGRQAHELRGRLGEVPVDRALEHLDPMGCWSSIIACPFSGLDERQPDRRRLRNIAGDRA
jgi:hypothetical protein